MDKDDLLAGLVRQGLVSALDAEKRMARVIFQDGGFTSGWLYVLQHFGAGVDVTPGGAHTHVITDSYTGGGSADTKANHNHSGTCVTHWMPSVNDMVLVLYLPMFNADGFILGGM